jgi:AcrR family transcriptional regulator
VPASETDLVSAEPSRARPEGYAKSRETRAHILAAALAVASESGLHRTSVTQIAARANTAVGSLNYHFGSRDGLLREVMRQLMADLHGRLATADAREGADFFDRYRAELLAYIDYVRANPAAVRLADEIKYFEPELYRQGIAGWVALISDKLRGGIAEGSIRSMTDSEITAQAHFLVGARQFLEDLVSDGSRAAEVVDAFLGLIRHGLVAPPTDQEHV